MNKVNKIRIRFSYRKTLAKILILFLCVPLWASDVTEKKPARPSAVDVTYKGRACSGVLDSIAGTFNPKDRISLVSNAIFSHFKDLKSIEPIGYGGDSLLLLLKFNGGGKNKVLKIPRRAHSRETVEGFRREKDVFEKIKAVDPEAAKYIIEPKEVVELGKDEVGVVIDYIPMGGLANDVDTSKSVNLKRFSLDSGEPSKQHALRVLKVWRQMAIALRGFHKAGLRHGDIKPSNILLDVDEKGVERVLLTDYTIPALKLLEIESVNEERKMTQNLRDERRKEWEERWNKMTEVERAEAKIPEFMLSNFDTILDLAGTRSHMAPRILDVNNPAFGKPEPKDDIYSLRLTLHEMLMGKSIWEFRGAEEGVEFSEFVDPVSGHAVERFPYLKNMPIKIANQAHKSILNILDLKTDNIEDYVRELDKEIGKLEKRSWFGWGWNLLLQRP